ncbi:MAG: hypothetical protein DMG40_17405 [Acidobacteria bacterium]|nr:MAG: hypothetical protein DMG40_17405 [Acidobacteriota bacterium]
MNRTVACLLVFLALSTAALCQSSSYYKAIQKGAPTQIQPKQFKEMEEAALKEYSRPEPYELLATSFGNTTEKVWALIYGEVFCNLSSDKGHVSQVGALMFEWYDKAIFVKGTSVSANLTENAEAPQKQPPFEPQFEIAFLMGAVPFGSDVKPLTIHKVCDIRKNQLALLAQKKIAANDLSRWQQAVITAGHFEAYNYWLFQIARPDEVSQWLAQHQTQFRAWLDWQNRNKFMVSSPNFQRLYIVRAR